MHWRVRDTHSSLPILVQFTLFQCLFKPFFTFFAFLVVIPHFLPELWIFPEAGRQVTFLCSAQLELLLQLHNYLSELGPAAAAASHNTAAMFILQIKHTSAVGSSR